MQLRGSVPILLALLGTVAVGPEACSVYEDSLLSAGGSDGGTVRDVSSRLCSSIKPPLAPPVQTAGPRGNIDLTFALSTFDFGERYAEPVLDGGERPAQDFGYDLDNLCTGPESAGLGDGDSCRPIDWMPPETQDFKEGRDNGLGRMIQSIATTLDGFGTPAYNEAIRQGRVSILLEIKGYNQTANDERVELVVYTAAPFDSLSTEGSPKPKFDGKDEWPITSTSYESNDAGELAVPLRARFRDPDAYVNDGVLVGRLSDTSLRLSVGVSPQVIVELVLNLLQAFYTAEVYFDEAAGFWKLRNGTIAARWPLRNLLDQLEQFPDPDDAPFFRRPLCMNTPSYDTFRRKICATVDILSGPGTSAEPCDAISMGIRFDAVQAIRGQTYVLDALGPRCPAEFSPKLDSCEFALDSGAPQIDAGDASAGFDASAGSRDAARPDAADASLRDVSAQ